MFPVVLFYFFLHLCEVYLSHAVSLSTLKARSILNYTYYLVGNRQYTEIEGLINKNNKKCIFDFQKITFEWFINMFLTSS